MVMIRVMVVVMVRVELNGRVRPDRVGPPHRARAHTAKGAPMGWPRVVSLTGRAARRGRHREAWTLAAS